MSISKNTRVGITAGASTRKEELDLFNNIEIPVHNFPDNTQRLNLDVLGAKYKKRDKENIIDFLVSNLKMSLTKVKRLIRNGLGYVIKF